MRAVGRCLRYFHVVFTLPAEVADIAFRNKALVYDLLFKAASETMLAIAADRKHLGARIGITAVLHTWGSAMTHHPHVHMIVPGGGIAPDGHRWISSRPAFLLPVRVLGKLFRRLCLMPVLWRTHDRHRGVRTLEAAARTATRFPVDREQYAVTRHGMVQRSAAGTQPPATDRRTSMVVIDPDTATPSRPPSRQHRAGAQRSDLSASIPALPGGGRAIGDTSRNPKSP
jgi:hypothetical protein